MRTLQNKSELRSFRLEQGVKKVVFVPTMGALHKGHATLLKEARKAAGSDGIVVASVFVNPTQFDQKDDFVNYPSTLESDLTICEQEAVDAVFIPLAEEMYREGASIVVTEQALSKTLCGAKRPGHFDGVCTVVLKLYHLVQPDEMMFGKKDFQQVAVIHRMVRDLDLPVTVTPVETVRETNGLALSSRNRRLTERAYAEAPIIYETLQKVGEALSGGQQSVSEVKSQFEEAFRKIKTPTNIDYVEVVNPETMEAVCNEYEGEVILAIAVFFEDIRLIDHITLCV